MDNQLTTLCDRAVSEGFFQRLETLFQKMDDAYDSAAVHYGFACTGCEDNCCLTRFHHHTHVEFLYLVSGFAALDEHKQILVRKKAIDYVREMEASVSDSAAFRRMCPLNEEGWCLVYARRPMICRLHGLPHELNPPGRGRLLSSGCGEFDRQCGGKAYFPLDRTPFYFGLSDLENEFKQAVGVTERLKLTIAQMITAIEE